MKQGLVVKLMHDAGAVGLGWLSLFVRKLL